MKNFSKLSTYKTLKKSDNTDTYLQLNILFIYKHTITKIRINHPTLQIERGRYTTLKTPSTAIFSLFLFRPGNGISVSVHL